VWLLAGLVLLDAVALVAAALSGASSIALAAGGVLVAVAVYRVGLRRMDIAARWRRGAHAERSVGDLLNELRDERFVVMHDIRQVGEGNIDHLVSGATGVYMIETKATRYESPQLTKAKRQAAKLGRELGVWVTPVICIHDRHGRPFRHHGVWIVPRPGLLDWLRRQRNATVPFDRLAQFADALA
jgi:hypothetical protein